MAIPIRRKLGKGTTSEPEDRKRRAKRKTIEKYSKMRSEMEKNERKR